MSQKQYKIRLNWMSLVFLLTACSTQTTLNEGLSSINSQLQLPTTTFNSRKIVRGQTIYIPIYSHIYHHNSKENAINLSATLSIRNTDLTNSIIITAVNYYDTDGQLIHKYTEKPVELKPLSTAEVFVKADDTAGGSGANFIVEWVTEKQVYEPVMEAVMISTGASQGISFVSSGRVLKEYQPSKPSR